MFITGLLTRIFHTWSASEDFNILVFCLSTISLIILHEIGHIIAGFAYDFDISDAGILFVNKIPIAAYILPNVLKTKNGTEDFFIQDHMA